MNLSCYIEGSQIFLKVLRQEEVGSAYVSWLNDPEINTYLESRHIEHTIETVSRFVGRHFNSPDSLLLGIYALESGTHIGNIKLDPILSHYRRATLGILIGDKDYWGKGIGTEAINLITGYAFDELNLHKIEAGCYAENIGSKIAFTRAGYEQEGVLKDHIFFKGSFGDCLLFGKARG